MSLSRHLEKEFRNVAPIKAIAFMVVDTIKIKLWSPAQEMLLGPEVVPGNEFLIVNIGLGIETGLGAEPVTASPVVKISVEAVPVTADVTFECGAREMGAVSL